MAAETDKSKSQNKGLLLRIFRKKNQICFNMGSSAGKVTSAENMKEQSRKYTTGLI